MKYLKFTYVDAITGISVASHPATNGPVFPPVKGLEYAWARESQYPTETPEFFGTCPDDAETQIDGVLGVYLQADWETMREDEMRTRPAVPTVESIRTQKWEAIKAERERRTQQGGYQAAGKWFHSDTFSRSQQLGLVIMGANIPPGLMWKTMDGSYIEMTQAVALLVFQAALASDSAHFQHAESLRMDVDTNPDPASVDINAGWPPVFWG